MKTYTAHLRPDRAPILVKEAFAWGAFLFGPFWLLAHRAWLAALGSVILFAATWAVRPPLHGALIFAVMLLLGLFGRDLVRWSLTRRGYQFAHVVAGRSPDDAYLRLLNHVPSGMTPA